MDTHEFANVLMSEERKSWQDPQKILSQIGVKSGWVVADLACGPDFFTMPLSAMVGSEGIVHAVDANPTMIEHLRKNVDLLALETKQNVKIDQTDAASTSIPNGHVDLVLFANVLHDIDDRTRFFKEVKRISKQEALIVDIDWHKRDTQIGPPIEIRLAEWEARGILRSNGLMIVHALNTGPHHYGFVCKKRP